MPPSQKRTSLSTVRLTPALTRLIMRSSRALIGLFCLWVLGFFWFSASIMALAPASPDTKTDVIAVLTGGSNRVDTGFDLMDRRMASAMLITGVHPQTSYADLVDAWNTDIPKRLAMLSHCCVALDTEAGTTEENALEIGRWLMSGPVENISTLRVVTSNYHMPRALLLVRRALAGIEIIPHPVKPTDVGMTEVAFWRNTLVEYNKFIITWLYTRIG